MKILLLLVVSFAFGSFSHAQSDLQKMIEAEKAFGALAAEKGTKHAFLANMTDDAVLFLPDKVNGRAYWNSRGESPGLLSWAPNYADISSNGIIGYTAGNWEYRPKGKDDAPTAFGQFVTVWQRGPNGVYKFIADIGIEHDKPAAYSTITAPPDYPSAANEKNSSAADTANSFFEITAQRGLAKAYDAFAAANLRSYREGSLPMLSKKKLVSYLKQQSASTTLAKRTVFFGSADIAYVTNTYTQTKKDNSVEKGNYLQIWKLVDGRWQIVLDIFKPVPAK